MACLLPVLLPADWPTPAVNYRYEVQLGKMLDEKQILGTHLAPYLRNVDVQWSGVRTAKLPSMDFSPEDRLRFSLRPGDLLVCEGGEVGRTAIWKGELSECFFQKALHRLRPRTNRDDPRFFRYFMVAAAASGLLSIGNLSTIAHLTATQLRAVRYPAPYVNVQRSIADHLDRETARVDALIEKKQLLIELLEEKRQAVITQAVTSGLDPDVPMKDSGVEWLGTVPEHWEVVKFSWVARITAPQVDPAEAAIEALPLIAPNHVQSGSGVLLDLESAADQGASSGKYLCQPRDVIYSKIRPALRKATIAPSICLCSADMYPITCDATLLPEFLLMFLLSEPFSFWAEGESGRVAMPKINRESLTELRLPLPTLDEQREIIARVQGEANRLGALRLATEKSIALLRERRSALITGAVTGQIDIREAAA